MKRNYRVYMIREDGREVYLGYNYRNIEDAELKAEACRREDEYERSIGYKVPETRYIVK